MAERIVVAGGVPQSEGGIQVKRIGRIGEDTIGEGIGSLLDKRLGSQVRRSCNGG